MPGATTFARGKILDHLRGKTAWAMPTAYIALFTVAPTESGGGTEANYGNYARIATSGADWTASSGSAGTNANAIVFPGCTSGSNAIVAWGVYDAATSGNLLWFGTCSITVTPPVAPRFLAGALTLNMTAP